MQDPPISFRELLHPLPAEEFFDKIYRKMAVHVPGHPQKFGHLFSWSEFNRLLNMSKLWSDHTMKMVLDGCDVDAKEFCRPGTTREGNQVMRVDARRATELLRRGATIILDLVETLAPGAASVAASLESVTGAVANGNVYCSWSQHQGFKSHYDTTDVFALHIEGQKTWRLYEGRAHQPVALPGFEFSSFPPEHHAQAKGAILKEVVMTPGDLLYIPRGQYHDALASSGASLHLSFGITRATGHDFLGILMRSLPDDPLFRESLPHFDNVSEHEAHLKRIADRLHGIITQAETSTLMREHQRERSFRDCFSDFALPGRADLELYRVRWLRANLVRENDEWLLRTPSAQAKLSDPESEIAKWALSRDYFNAQCLVETFSDRDPNFVAVILGKLVRLGLLEKL